MGKEVEPVVAGGEVVIPDDVMAEMEAASREQKAAIDVTTDVRLPQLRLVQATTQDVEAAAGQLFDSLTGAALDEVDAIVLDMYKSRALFGGDNVGDPPTCTSPDAINGFGDPGGDCLRCPHADWRSGGRCQLRYNYFAVLLGDGFDPEHELPRGVMMHGTSAKVATRLNTMLFGSKFFWSNVVHLSSVQETNKRGTYKVWEARRSRPAKNASLVSATSSSTSMREWI